MRLLSAALKQLSRRDPPPPPNPPPPPAAPRGHRPAPASPALTPGGPAEERLRSPRSPSSFTRPLFCLLVYFSLILSGLGCEIPRLLRGGQAARKRGEWTGEEKRPRRPRTGAAARLLGGGGFVAPIPCSQPPLWGTCPTPGRAPGGSRRGGGGATTCTRPGRAGRWGKGRETWLAVAALGPSPAAGLCQKPLAAGGKLPPSGLVFPPPPQSTADPSPTTSPPEDPAEAARARSTAGRRPSSDPNLPL